MPSPDEMAAALVQAGIVGMVCRTSGGTFTVVTVDEAMRLVGAAPDYEADFELLWNAYPKRNGGNPKQGARRQYLARLKEGADFSEMHDGVLRYAAYCHATAKVGTELVMMMQTFLGRDRRWQDEYAVPDAERWGAGGGDLTREQRKALGMKY